jgi:hypothetical protein
MIQSRSDEWTPRQARELVAWKNALLVSLTAALSKGTTVEFLTHLNSREARLIRFVNIFDGLTKINIEVMYPEPIDGIVTRVLEVINEHTDRLSEGTG